MTQRTVRPHRRRRAAAVVAALVALLAAVALTPAYADIYEDDGGKPGTQHYEISTTGNAEFHCTPEGDWVRTGHGIVYDGPFPKCRDRAPDIDDTGDWALCQPAMQVFRFYGTVRRPVVGWATSMVAQQQWCTPLEARMWSTSAYDVQNRLNPETFDKEALGRAGEPDPGQEPLPETLNGRGFNMHPMYALSWSLRNAPDLITAGRPFAGNKGCARAQTENPFRRDLRDPEVSAERKAQLVADLRDRFRDAKQDFKSQYGVGNAAALAAAQKLTGIESINGTTVEFETQACASAMQYVTTADLDRIDEPAEQGRYRVTGVCYIPIERLARGVVGHRTGREEWTWPAILNDRSGGGLRYSDYYKGTDYTQGHFVRQLPRLPGRYQRSVENAWRDQMETWYLDRTSPRIASLTNGRGKQVVPAQPYKTTGNGATRRVNLPATRRMPKFNRDAAAAALRKFARCQFGPHMYYHEASGSQEPPSPQANLSVENQAVHQAGGYGSPEQGFSVVDRGLTCDDSSQCVGRDITFTRLTYTIRVTGPEGWQLGLGQDSRRVDTPDAVVWVTSGPVTGGSCSGNVCTIPVRATASGSRVRVQMRYFKPTLPDELVNVAVQGVRVRFRQIVDRVTTAIGTDTNGEEYTYTVTTPVVRRVLLEDIDVTGNPVPLRRTGRVYDYDMKVLGATSVR